MVVFRLTKAEYSKDLRGEGAALYPGRWNVAGVPVLYTAEVRSLALVELLANMLGKLQAKAARYTMMEIALPSDGALFRRIEALPKNWKEDIDMAGTRQAGASFVKEGRLLGLWVPSVLLPREYNLLINPKHPAAGQIHIQDSWDFVLDERFFGEK